VFEIAEFLPEANLAFPVAALRAAPSQRASFVISFTLGYCVNFTLAY